ncbi:MAG: branched-chain amino acid ABC transporter permease [Actinomycetales bacterium]|nr:branched-chain amino acid ABC transporter permease [Actinomycetales bacterium]
MAALFRIPGVRLIGSLLLVIVGYRIVYLWINDNVDPLMNFWIAQGAVYATALFGMVILVGLSGQVSLGNGALMAVGGYGFGVASLAWGLDPFPAVVVSVLLGIGFGLVVGVIAARLRGPYLAGLTLALAVGLPAIANRFPAALGGEEGLFVDVSYPPEQAVTAFGVRLWGPYDLDFPVERWQAWLAGALMFATLFVAVNLARGRQGRIWRAARDNPVAAALCGVNPANAKVLAFTVSSAAAAAAGAAFAQLLGVVSPGAFALGLSLSLLVGVVLGGRSSLTGAFIGAAILVALPQLVVQAAGSGGWDVRVTDNLPTILYGLLVVLVVILAPGGIVGSLTSGWRRLRHRG